MLLSGIKPVDIEVSKVPKSTCYLSLCSRWGGKTTSKYPFSAQISRTLPEPAALFRRIAEENVRCCAAANVQGLTLKMLFVPFFSCSNSRWQLRKRVNSVANCCTSCGGPRWAVARRVVSYPAVVSSIKRSLIRWTPRVRVDSNHVACNARWLRTCDFYDGFDMLSWIGSDGKMCC